MPLDAAAALKIQILDIDRDGHPVTTELALDGDWRRWDVSWRKSIRLLTWRAAPALRFLQPVPAAERGPLGGHDQGVPHQLVAEAVVAVGVGVHDRLDAGADPRTGGNSRFSDMH